jgi:hypothetical protein
MSAHTSYRCKLTVKKFRNKILPTGIETFQIVCASYVEARECNNLKLHRQADEEMVQRGAWVASVKCLEWRNDWTNE